MGRQWVILREAINNIETVPMKLYHGEFLKTTNIEICLLPDIMWYVSPVQRLHVYDLVPIIWLMQFRTIKLQDRLQK